MAGKGRKTLKDWAALAAKELKGGDPESLSQETSEGIAIKPLYTGADLKEIKHLGGLPGFAPFGARRAQKHGRAQVKGAIPGPCSREERG